MATEPVPPQEVSLDILRGLKCVGVEEAAATLGIGRTRAYAMAKSGELPSLRLGHRRVIPVQVLTEWIASRSREQQEAARAASDALRGEARTK